MLYAAHKGVFDLAVNEDREVPVVVTDFATAELVKVGRQRVPGHQDLVHQRDGRGLRGGRRRRDASSPGRSATTTAIGKKFLRAGIGFGGGCLPKDIRAFQARAQELGAGEALRFLHEVDLINQRRRSRVVQLAAELLGRPYGPAGPDLSGLRIAVLGATFKPNTDDVRDSPALSVARDAGPHRGPGRRVRPAGDGQRPGRELPDVDYGTSMNEVVTGADLVCVLTEWEEFRYADPAALAELVTGKRVIDGRQLPRPALVDGRRVGVPGHGAPGRLTGPG